MILWANMSGALAALWSCWMLHTVQDHLGLSEQYVVLCTNGITYVHCLKQYRLPRNLVLQTYVVRRARKQIFLK